MSEGKKQDSKFLLEQYKLCVEMADKVSQRRQSANNYCLSVNTFLLSFLAYLTSIQVTSAVMIMIALVGILLCLIWFSLIRSYKNLNSAKFKVIIEMEKLLGDYHPYDREWDLLKRGEDKKLYSLLTHVESKIPLLFASLYVFLILILFFRFYSI